MKRFAQMLITLTFAVGALIPLFPAASAYDDGTPLNAMCWFALDICIIGIGGLIYLAVSTIPEDKTL